MKKSILIFITLLFGMYSNAQVNQMKIGKGGITFQDGEVMNTSISPSAGIPGGGEIAYLLAEFSDGIIGDSPNVDWENHVELLGLDSYMFKDVNQFGHPTGAVKNRYFVISKPVDVATADLMSFYNTGTPIQNIKIKMIASPDGSALQEILRITLNGAQIVEYRTDLDYNPASSAFYYTEKFYLSYGSIEFDHFGTGDNAMILWRF